MLQVNAIYHVTNNSTTSLETISNYAYRFMKINGIRIVYGDARSLIDRNPAEELFDRLIEPYRPYLSDTRVFERVNLGTLEGNIHPPEFSYGIFNRCMEYATTVQWGESVLSG